VLYSGLGWLSGMRTALEALFVLPPREQPNFVVGKLRDVASLLLVGLTMVLSVALSGLVAGFSESVLGWFGVDPDGTVPHVLLWLISHGLAIAASTALLLTLFTLLAQPHVPRRSLLDGAILGAVGFEVLKGVAYFLIAQTKSQPAFQAFGVALVLVVWINYFSRLVLYAASYAYTSPAAARKRQAESIAVAAESTPVDGTGEVGGAPVGEPTADTAGDPEAEVVAMGLPVVAVPAAAAPAAAAPGVLASGAESRDGPARGGPVVAAAAVVTVGAAAFAAWRRGRMAR
jgi:membrane protein